MPQNTLLPLTVGDALRDFVANVKPERKSVVEGNTVMMVIGIETMLCVVWNSGTLILIISSLTSSHYASIHGTILQFARRGKTMATSNQRFTVPQKFFLHFYVIAVLWTTILLFATFLYALRLESLVLAHSDNSDRSTSAWINLGTQTWKSVFRLILMEIQVWRRLYDTAYVFKYSPHAMMHILGYLTGLFFYAAAPLSLCSVSAPAALMFTVEEARQLVFGEKKLIQNLSNSSMWCGLDVLTKLDLCQWFGMVVFFWGWHHQYRCHTILGSLRKSGINRGEYVIPRGDWFDIVSSPHYLAEIIMYAALVIASGANYPTILSLFGFVVANLMLAAIETHRWYHNKFEDYPGNRYALFPLII